MKKIFRITALLAVFCLLFVSLAGCGGSSFAVDEESFQNPSSENGILKMAHNIQKLYGQDVMENYLNSTLLAKGYAGIVTNYPLGGEYLTAERSWEILREQLGWLQENGIRYWIYDEDGYPSGGAGTLTLEGHPEYEALGICRVTAASEDGKIEIPLPATHEVPFAAYACPGTGDSDRDLSERIDITDAIDPETGDLVWECPDGESWVAETFGLKPLYDDTHAEGNASEDRRYINIMDRDAVARFIEVTYQAYYDNLGPEVFEGIECFFTDEPSLIHMYLSDFGADVPVVDEPNPDFVRWPTLAWSRNFLEEFSERNGYDLSEHLTSLFTGETEEDSRVRYDYWNTAAQLVAENYYGQIGDWCREHGVGLSGHMLAEETINEQVICEGNFFENYRQMGMPGIDMLTASPEQVLNQAMTPKIASSASRLYSDGRVMSESCEYTLVDDNGNLTISIQQIRCSLALQYALGVTQINSYFEYNELSPDDEAEQDITGKMVARLGDTVMLGTRYTDVAIFYPCETMYAELIPTTKEWNEPQSDRVSDTTESFQNSFYALLNGNLDPDILPASALIEGSVGEDGFTTASGESYRALVIPTLSMLSEETVSRLEEMADAGVKLFFMPQETLLTPTGEDTASVAARWNALQEHENAVAVSGSYGLCDTVREALGQTDITVTQEGVTLSAWIGGGAEIIAGHWVTDTSDIYLLVHPSAGSVSLPITFSSDATKIRILDPLTGEITAVKDAVCENGTVSVTLDFDNYDFYFVELA